MRKILLIVMTMGFMCWGGKLEAQNTGDVPVPGGSDPVMIGDSIRGLTASIMSLLESGPHPQVGADLNVTQEEVGALEDGDESYRVDEGTGSADGGGSSDLAISAYDYMKEKVFTNSKRTPYAPLNKRLTKGADMKKVVTNMFFIEKESDNTEAKQAEIVKNRTEYLTTVGKEYTRLAYEMQKKIADDMSAVGSDINGNGSIGAVAGMDQTWKAVNKALIADIGMQIQLMELDAAKFLSVQPIMIMSKERPETSNQGAND